jgi:hypothetical protein
MKITDRRLTQPGEARMIRTAHLACGVAGSRDYVFSRTPTGEYELVGELNDPQTFWRLPDDHKAELEDILDRVMDDTRRIMMLLGGHQ